MKKYIEFSVPFDVSFSPNDIQFTKYVFPELLQKVEAEEMVARFLEQWQLAGHWCGVSLKEVSEKINHDASMIEQGHDEGYATLIHMELCRDSHRCTSLIHGILYLIEWDYIDVRNRGYVDYIFPTKKLCEVLRPLLRKWVLEICAGSYFNYRRLLFIIEFILIHHLNRAHCFKINMKISYFFTNQIRN